MTPDAGEHIPVLVRMDWPYDDALAEMRAARDDVVNGGAMRIFVGSHKEEVVTLGRHASEAQLIARAALDARGVLVRRIERGGGATAHGPGQLVAYPVIDMRRCGFDVVGLTEALLSSAATLAAELGVTAAQGEPAGLYVGDQKLASIGFRIERRVVTHGLAVNIDNDLSLFELIAPCGVCDQRVASIASLSGRAESGRASSKTSERPSLSGLAQSLGLHVARRCVLASTAARTQHAEGTTQRQGELARGTGQRGTGAVD